MNAAKLLFFLPLVGCASTYSLLTEGHVNRDTVPVVPGSKAVMMTGTYEDTDKDGFVKVPRGNGPFQANNGVVDVNDKTVGHITPSFSPLLFGNVFSGGVPGALTDGIGGGMWDLRYKPTGGK